MKAAICSRYGPADEVFRIAEVEEPVPGPGEVRVRIHATVVTGSDVIVRGSKVSPTLSGRPTGILAPQSPLRSGVICT